MTPSHLLQAVLIGVSANLCLLVFLLTARLLWRRLDQGMLDAVTVMIGAWMVLR